MKLSVVAQLEELLVPLFRRELSYGVQPDFHSLIYRHRLRHAGPNDARFAVGRGVYKVFVLCQEKQLFALQTGEDQPIVDSSVA
jgi:hypothetical protein